MVTSNSFTCAGKQKVWEAERLRCRGWEAERLGCRGTADPFCHLSIGSRKTEWNAEAGMH